ncbi:hypothetical protein [Myroides odoratus]|uniref:Uncharacterized protein n=1 Tax=Myroides odoratus TaxID=256 RepID=A0A378RN01_MYROD|nr:hypothetical protein [Myroides odoratus]QQU04198.1 hypothetical protein I6I89_02615 [Myroides odoratus]STZ28396.1 Uncharacterised protein [Myroides odoratus]
MENNEYFFLDFSEEVENHLLFNDYKKRKDAINEGELELFIIVNKSSKQFWINGKPQLNHAKKMTPIKFITFKDLQKWQTK